MPLPGLAGSPPESAIVLQIIQPTTDEHFAQARQLIAEMARWDGEQSLRLGLDPQEVMAFFYSYDDEELRREGAPPAGRLLLTTVADIPAGCAAFRRIDEAACELHNVYVRDQFRGQRIGRRMVEQLVAAAKHAGYSVMRLETTPFMPEAQALYASLGFRSRGPYREVPKIFEPWTVFMELALADLR
jgi:GNAT superfamily N-acetyltransferase